MSPSGEFRLLPDETFNDYHTRREVMKRFNEAVAASDERNLANHPDAADPASPLGAKVSAKAAFLRQNEPAFFESKDWPEQLTERCLKDGG